VYKKYQALQSYSKSKLELN